MSKEIIRHLRTTTPTYHTGWGGPEYSGWQDEQMSWKTTCYVGDWSFLADAEFEGDEALPLFKRTSVNSFEKFEIGQAKHVIQCSSGGKVIAEGVLMRMGENLYRAQSTPAMYTTFLIARDKLPVKARVIDTFQLQVSGPNALAVCEKATGEDLKDIGFMRFREVAIAGRKVYALRQGMAGEIGFELHGDASDKDTVLAAILQAGAPLGIRRLGHRTALINHLEAAFPTGMWHYVADVFGPETKGYPEHIYRTFDLGGLTPALRGSFEAEDISEYAFSPFEMGWGKSVKFDHDFVGRAALEDESRHPRRTRVTLQLNSDDMIDVYASLFREEEPYEFMDIPHQPRYVAWADQVLKDGVPVGVSTVPGYSFYFRKILALAYVDVAVATPGTTVEIVWGSPGSRQRRIRATVAAAPYKKDFRRAALSAAQPAQGPK